MSRSKVIRWATISVATILAVSSVAIWRFESRFIYSRYFGSYRFGVEYGAETDFDGRHRVINTSFYNPPVLMYGVHPFRTPTGDAPKFKAVSDTNAGLHCVYDTLGWGYIAIVDTKTQSFFCAEPAPSAPIDAPDWQDKFNTLKRTFPDLPYASTFMGPTRRGPDQPVE